MNENRFTPEERRSLDTRATKLLEDNPRTIDLIAASARRLPGSLALAYLRTADDREPVSYTYEELMAQIASAVAFYRNLGVGADDVVSIMAPSCPATFVALWAAMGCAAANPLNLLYSRDAMLAQISAVGAKVLIVPPPGTPGGIFEKAEGLIGESPTLKRILVAPLDGRVAFDGRDLEPDAEWDHCIRDLARPGDANRVAGLYPTGGTTGSPKIARLTHRNMVSSTIGSLLSYDHRPDDRVMVGLPLFHVGGAFVGSLATLAGGGAVFVPTAAGYRNPAVVENFWRLVAMHRITVTGFVPTTLSVVAAVPRDGIAIDTLRFVGVGAAPCPAEIERRFLAAWGGDAVRQIYGMTEFAGAITHVPYDKSGDPGSVGLPVALAETAVLIDGKVGFETDQTGELVVKGPQCFAGYVDPRHNNDTHVDGWLRTGDLCRLNANGQIQILGRVKDLIIRGGHNIDPLMIEEAAAAFPGVALAAAVGRPDAYAGETPMLFVTPLPGAHIEAEELRCFVEDRVAEKPARPKDIEILAEMPMTLVGKIFKPRLREIAAERAAQDVLARTAPQASASIKAAIDPARGLVVRVESLQADAAALTAMRQALAELPLLSEITAADGAEHPIGR
jgi:fatty-acyl-CoA synthase